MSDRRSRLLLDGAIVRVFEVWCRAPCAGYGAEEWSGTTQIVLPRRGVFVVERAGEPVVVDVNTVLVLGRGDEYRVRHPVDGGDDCAVLVFAPALLEEALGGEAGTHATMRTATQLRGRLATSALRDANDRLAAEETLLVLLHMLAADLAAAPAPFSRVRPSQRRRVEDVRALLASRPTAEWGMEAVGQAVHCSPYHLARQFRAITGETIARYLLRLRLGLALERMAAGCDDLSRLALETGFAHHSHFSSRFRALFGMTPSAARTALNGGALRELRSIVTAEGPGAP
jgi:AraC family transcriptional regulator